jgi:molybdopterin-guanine dinucleotide biosynthesis protein A
MTAGQPGIAGAVLCGGRSSRMGADKAFVEVAGVAMAERVAGALEAAGCAPVAFVGGDEAGLRRFGRSFHPDRWPGEGPLGGVLTALVDIGGDVVVAACDLPFLDPPTIRRLISAAGPAVDVAAAATDRLQPAVAWWGASARLPIEDAWRDGVRALHVAVARLRAVQVAVDPDALRNVNAPADLG